MRNHQKLELTWVGKDERQRLEPRILIEDPELSFMASERISNNDVFDNRLIFGDNLLALKSLEQEFAGKVKCIFIDPPYNTGSAFTHYNDGLEHSLWLTMMRDRLELLRRLLSDDGSIWITIDDNEAHYLKVLCDEVMGRSNFVASLAWQKVYTSKNSAKHFSAMHDHILVYASNKETWELNLLPRSEKQDKAYTNPDNDPRGPWKATPLHARNFYSQGSYEVQSPKGISFLPPPGRFWAISKTSFDELQSQGRIWWGRDGTGTPNRKSFLSEVKQGVSPSTIWFFDEAGHNAEAKNEINALALSEDVFITPKPEKLVMQALTIASNKGDLILDSFAGSGTTGAVAHKMGRRWIMVELGDHCHTLVIPRMRKVIDGTDQGGISKAVGWKGGGGFQYYRLADTLLKRDKYGRLVINEEYNAEMLAEAMCKHMGFLYRPSQEQYWIHGLRPDSDDRSYLYVTTQSLSTESLAHLSDEVGDDRHLVVTCTSWHGNEKQFKNLEVLKIPTVILSKCEFGEDYSARIAKLGWREPEAEPQSPKEVKARKAGQDSLLDLAESEVNHS